MTKEELLMAMPQEEVVKQLLQTQAALMAERHMTAELESRLGLLQRGIPSDQDRYAEFLIEAMKPLASNRLPGTLPGDIVRWAGQIADGLYEQHMAKWARP